MQLLIATFQHLQNPYQVSISPMLYERLLCTQIPKVPKETKNFTIFIALLGSVYAKAAHRPLMKFTPRVNFINILFDNFSYKSAMHSFSLVTFWLCNFLVHR